MINSLYIAQTGLEAHQKLIDTISNNLANTNTAGYKKEQVRFVDLVYSSPEQADKIGRDRTDSKQLHGVTTARLETDFSQGSLKVTGHPLDLAIRGHGLIEITRANGDKAYSRGGRLVILADGVLATANGDKLNADISIPPDGTDLKISPEGVVSIRLPGEESPVELGNIALVRFSNPDALQTVGGGVYLATLESGEPQVSRATENGTGSFLQGFTEQSNVSMTEEMVNLMLAQRGYQLNARIIQVSDQILETINNLRR